MLILPIVMILGAERQRSMTNAARVASDIVMFDRLVLYDYTSPFRVPASSVLGEPNGGARNMLFLLPAPSELLLA
ncbi:hypothetical protein AYO40_04940 [Planctomycetaceae bacterium SCGC AG-212-D15]|nr:hypothetical protein AYO40_04940 [Planctomycetaceae bacterium SCGC AG-212-D15]